MWTKAVDFIAIVCGVCALPFLIVFGGRWIGRQRNRWHDEARVRTGDVCVACGQPIVPPSRATKRDGGLRHYYQCPPKQAAHIRLAPKDGFS